MTGFNSKRAMAQDKLQGDIMGAVKDMYYDVETLFIEGASAAEISSQLIIPIEAVYEVLKDFGVDPEDFVEPKDEIYSPYYGA